MKNVTVYQLIGPNPPKSLGLMTLAKNVEIIAKNETRIEVNEVIHTTGSYYDIAVWLPEFLQKSELPIMAIQKKKMYILLMENETICILDNKKQTLLRIESDGYKAIKINDKLISIQKLKFTKNDNGMKIGAFTN